MSDFEVRYTDGARDDLLRLFDFLLACAQTAEDLDDAQQVIDDITQAIEGQLSRTPFIYRKLGVSPLLRELMVPSRRSGNVALYEIDGEIGAGKMVNILAVRHQLEDDYL
jgi:plasmid stabilization system protein ParE